MHSHVCLLGFPGSGKTTQGKLLAGLIPDTRLVDMSQVLGIVGSLDQEFRLVCDSYQASGLLVPDNDTMKALRSFLGSVRQGNQCVFCGVPRNKTQAEMFLEMRSIFAGAFPITAIRLLPESRSQAAARCVARAEEAKMNGQTVRPDDLDPEIVERRLVLYEQNEAPVIEVLSREMKIIDVQSKERKIDTFKSILAALNFSDRCEIPLV